MRPYPTYLLLSGVASFAGATAHTLNLVYWVQSAGLGPFQIVIAGTVLEAVYFLSQLPTGILADLRSRRLSVVLGYLLLGVGTLTQGAWASFGAILAGTVVTGVGYALVDGAEEAWASDEIGPERAGQTFARAAQVAQATSIGGILAATALALAGLRLPVLAGGAAYLALGLFLAFAMPERNFEPVAAGQRPSLRAMRLQLADGVRVVRSTPALVGILGMVFFLGLGSEGIDRFWQPHLLEDGPLPPTYAPVVWFGGLSVASALLAIAVTEVVRRHITTDRPRRIAHALVAGQIVVVTGVAVFALAGTFWLAALGFLALTLARSALGPMISTWTVAHSAASTRATVFSITGQADAAGQILGGPPIGLVGERISIRAGLLAAAALLTPAIGFTAATLRRDRAHPPAPVEPEAVPGAPPASVPPVPPAVPPAADVGA